MNEMTTGPALEAQPAAIALVRVPTLGASTGRVARVHGDDDKTVFLGLVRQEVGELVKRPGVNFGARPLTESAPAPDAFQIFNDNGRATASLGELYDTPGSNVIHVPVEAHLPAPRPFQDTPETPGVLLCLSGLEGCPSLPVLDSDGALMPAAKEQSFVAVRGNSGESDAPVYTNYSVVGTVDSRDLSAEGNQQIRFLAPDSKESPTKLPFGQKLDQPRRSVIRNLQPTLGRADSHPPFTREESEVPAAFPTLEGYGFIVEHNRLARRTLEFLERHVSSGYGACDRYSHLRRQVEPFSDRLIALRLDRQCPSASDLEGHAGSVVAGSGEIRDHLPGKAKWKVDSNPSCSYQFHHKHDTLIGDGKSSKRGAGERDSPVG